jgi:hypothetical protein
VITHRHIAHITVPQPCWLTVRITRTACLFVCLQLLAPESLPGFSVAILDPRRSPCVCGLLHASRWWLACHNAVRAAAFTLAYPRPEEARVFVFICICCMLCNTTCQARGYYPDTEFIVISENIFPETLCLLSTECQCTLWCVKFCLLTKTCTVHSSVSWYIFSCQ